MTRSGKLSSFLIWYANIDELKVDSPSWVAALTRLTEAERKKVTSYLFDDDKKRALYSIMLQHALVKRCLHVKEGDYSIVRTPENKPFACSPVKPKNKAWNYNVSHHGRYVCIASHSSFLV
jgi:phosphopantetheinyl transferase